MEEQWLSKVNAHFLVLVYGCGGFYGLHIQQRHQKRKGGFSPLIFVYAVRMQSVPAPSGRGVVEWNLQVVLSEKPPKGRPCFVQPQTVFGCPVCLETRSDGGTGLHRLLVEASLVFPLCEESRGADRHKHVVVVSMLLGGQPIQRLTPCLDHSSVLTVPASENQSLRQARVGIGEGPLEPTPVLSVRALVKVQQPVCEQIARSLDDPVSREPV